jgi:hypothetical protein
MADGLVGGIGISSLCKAKAGVTQAFAFVVAAP